MRIEPKTQWSARPSAAEGRVPAEAQMLFERWADLPALITVQEAAHCLGISRSAAYRGAERGELPVIRLAGRMRVPVARLMVLVGLLQTPPAGPLGRSEEHQIAVGLAAALTS